MTHTLPKDFLVGTSSSGWQIDGNAGKKPGQKSWADLFYETDPSRWHDGIGPETATDFYHHYKEDIHTMAEHGMRAFRFTIQWARLMKDPLTGEVDPDAAAWYADVIKTIREAGMEPVISLEHWDIPAVLFEKGDGWAERRTVSLYVDYVKKALELFHNDVRLWFAFTEPNIPIDNGYLKKLWYPFKHDPKAAYQAHFHKILAAANAVKISKSYPDIVMGVMVHMTPVYAASEKAGDAAAAYYADLFEVRLYLDALLKGKIPDEVSTELDKYGILFEYEKEDLELIQENTIDLLGIDYYFPIRVQARKTPYEGPFSPHVYYEDYIWPEREFNADRGWEIYPKAIYDTAIRLRDEYGNKPWIVSENGIGIENEGRYRNGQGMIEDEYRIDFIRRHLEQTLKAREEGCNVHGYFIWSFVDNVSALNAFKNRYGLLELDTRTLKRTPKKSLEWLKGVLEKSGLE